MISIFFALLAAAAGLAMVGAFIYLVFINVITFFNLFGTRDREVKVGLSTVLSIAVFFLLGAGIFNAGVLTFMGCCSGFIIAWRKLLQAKSEKETTGFYPAFSILSYLIAGGLLGGLSSIIFSLSFAFFLSTLLGIGMF
ncbi:MAG: hypothetical protein ABW007_03735 [Chitinophagaceae bacterium]